MSGRSVFRRLECFFTRNKVVKEFLKEALGNNSGVTKHTSPKGFCTYSTTQDSAGKTLKIGLDNKGQLIKRVTQYKSDFQKTLKRALILVEDSVSKPRSTFVDILGLDFKTIRVNGGSLDNLNIVSAQNKTLTQLLMDNKVTVPTIDKKTIKELIHKQSNVNSKTLTKIPFLDNNKKYVCNIYVSTIKYKPGMSI